MFSFLNPMFLWAAAAAIVPLVLHLMQKRRVIRMPFSTIRFLKMAEKRSSRRIRMQNLLLWLLRTLILLLIALAFAVPLIRTQAFGNVLGRAQRDVAVVLDHSYSMQYESQEKSSWEQAVGAAIDVVNGLNDGDRVCVFLATTDVQPVLETLNEDRDFVISQLRALKPGTDTSQFGPALSAAYAALQEDKRRCEKEIHILTDGQALPWATVGHMGRDEKTTDTESDHGTNETGIAGRSWDPDTLDKRTAVFVSLLGPTAPVNAAPVAVDISPTLIMPDSPAKAEVRITHTDGLGDISVSMRLDGKDLAEKALLPQDGLSAGTVFTIPPLPAGTHVGTVSTSTDPLEIDNTFYFLVKVREKLPALCAGTADDTLYLRTALTAGENSPIDLTSVSRDELASEDLSRYACVFLCNVFPLQGQAILEIENYVEKGGVVVIFPGDRAIAQDYSALKILPGSLQSVENLPASSRAAGLRWNNPRHPLLSDLSLPPGSAPAVTIRRILNWENISAAADTLITAGADIPFLVSARHGDGDILVFSISADRSWSNFPLSPFFLPILHQAVRYGAGVQYGAPYFWITRTLPLAGVIPDAGPESILLSPTGDAVPIRRSLSGRKEVLVAEDLLLPGIYELKREPDAQPEPAVAVNVPGKESALSRIKTEQIEDIIDIDNLHVCTGTDELLRMLEEYRMGRSLGETLLWIVLILATIEVIYANRKSQSTRSLSEILGVEPSGRLPPGGNE